MATDYALLGVCVLVLLPILIKFFSLTDCNLIIVGLTFRILRLFILSFSNSTFKVFFSTVLGSPSALIVSCCKASISKVVNDDERGKIFALVSCAETVAILTGSVIFVSVYNSTKTSFRGSVFIFEALFFLAMLGMVYFVGKDMKEEYDEMGNPPLEDLNNNVQSSNLEGENDNVEVQMGGMVKGEGVVEGGVVQDTNTTLINKPNKNPFYNPEWND